jgi:hypothetical protein
MIMGLDLTKLAQGLTGKERAKVLIANWQAKMDGKNIFSDADERALLDMYDERMDRECWYFIELYRWPYLLWRKEIERIWQVLLLIFQNIATLRTLPDDIKEHSFVMFNKEEMAVMAAFHLRELAEYQRAIAEIEKHGDGFPLFGEAVYKSFRERFDHAKQLRELNNTWVTDFKLSDNLLIVELKPREEYAKFYVEEVLRMAQFFVRKRESLGGRPAL